jgi:hypothetical protein
MRYKLLFLAIALACFLISPMGKEASAAGTFTQVSAGHYHTCGLKTDGTLACWGDNSYGQASPPTAPVGGIAEYPLIEPDAAPSESSSPGPNALVLAGLAAGSALLLAAGGWYAGKRWQAG